jgi:hypothetical protein
MGQLVETREASGTRGYPLAVRLPPHVRVAASAEGRNAVRVQHWLGQHSAAFTLSTCVHVLAGDIGAPLDIGPRLASEAARVANLLGVAG